jgi:hypothetical protein
LLLGGLVALAATACQVRTTVSVDVEEDGSGAVEVAVGLDAEAVERLPDLDGDGESGFGDLAALVRTDDLADAGWDVSEPSTSADGWTWTRATKRFGTPEEAERVLGEITGPDGVLRDLRVERDEGFGRTSYSFQGTADLSGGLEAFGDEGLAAALDGEPLGLDAAAIEQELGRPLAEMFTLEVAADLPGDGAPPRTWRPVLGGEPVEMAAGGTVRDWPVIGFAVAAVACAVALGVVLALRARRPGTDGAMNPAASGRQRRDESPSPKGAHDAHP